MSQVIFIICICIYNTSCVYNIMRETYNHSSIYLGKKTREKIDNYAKEHDLSRSSTIKFMVNEFLKENKDDK